MTTDIVERLRSRSARSQGGMDELDREAADEIERLRRLCQDLADVQRQNEETYGKAADEIERLRVDNKHLATARKIIEAEVERLREDAVLWEKRAKMALEVLARQRHET